MRSGFVRINVDGERKKINRARLIAMAFHDHQPEEEVLRFKDGNGANVDPDNIICVPRHMVLVERQMLKADQRALISKNNKKKRNANVSTNAN